MISALHTEARRLASSGTPVFPCWPGSKKPYCEHGFHDATTDLNQIDLWWSEEPNLNIAYCPHSVGEAVIDIDGDEGEQSFEDWQSEHGWLPLTRTIRTPRGGRHLYFRGSLPATQSKLGRHLDTRGVGSYALVPPSVVNGNAYSVIDSRPPAALPDSVGEYLENLRKASVRSAIADLDLSQNVQRARRYLQDQVAAGRVCIQGQMGDGTTYAVACEVMNLGVSKETTFKLMWEEWAPHAQPFDDRFETFLQIKIENAASYAQNEAGAWGVGSSQDTFAAALDKLSDAELEPSLPSEPASINDKKSRFQFRTWEALKDEPPPTWLLPDLLPEKGLSLLYGRPGTLKTYLAIEWACTLAALGRPVVYIAAEGRTGVVQRIGAWRLANGIDGPLPIYIVDEAPRAMDESDTMEFVSEAVKQLPFKPDLLVLDTVARATAGLDENSAKDMGVLVEYAGFLKRSLDTAVLLIHHAGKDESRGARGSESLTAGTDAAFCATRPNPSVPVINVKCVRQKDAEERTEPWAFQGQRVAGQLVLKEIDAAQFASATNELPRVERMHVGAALKEMGASEALGVLVSTHQLAFHLAHKAFPKDPDAADEALSGFQAVLVKGAKGYLQAYVVEGSSPIQWARA